MRSVPPNAVSRPPQVGEVVRVATSGDFDAQVARLNLDNRAGLHSRARRRSRLGQDIDTLANLRVTGRDGLVPLSSVAERLSSKRPFADRSLRPTSLRDGEREISAACRSVRLWRRQWSCRRVKGLPSSVKLIETGDAEVAAEPATGFSMALAVGVLCVFSVLVLLFRDFLQPITILSADSACSLGGALVALLLAA